MNQRVAKRSEEVKLATLKFIYEFQGEHGYPPSLREIMVGAKFLDEKGERVFWTTSHVHLVIEHLTKDGFLTHNFNMARTLRLTDAGREVLWRRIYVEEK